MGLKCTRCNLTPDKCQCPDFDERIRRIVWSADSQVAVKWCIPCDKHYLRCKCEPPKFTMVCQGKAVEGDTFMTAEGYPVKIDLNSR